MVMNWNPDASIWGDFLELDPQGQRANYYAQLNNRQGFSPNQKRYFQDQFQDVQNKYLGRLGQQVFGGEQPDEKLTDFYRSYFAPQGGADQDWASMSPRSRGVNTARFAPPTRWNV